MQHHHQSKFRRQDENFIYGIHPVLEAFSAGKAIEKILIHRELKSSALREILDHAGENDVPVQKVPLEKLNSLTRNNHQGIVAFVSLVEYQSIDTIIMNVFERGEVPLLIMLDRITDVRNLGAIARSAECAGAQALIVPSRGSALINADAVKTSAGALTTLPVHRSPNLKETIAYLRDSGINIVAVTEYAKKSYDQADLKGPVLLILGSEEEGISQEYLKLCDERIQIPMMGVTGSLNVSVAAGIALFEVNRQRRGQPA